MNPKASNIKSLITLKLVALFYVQGILGVLFGLLVFKNVFFPVCEVTRDNKQRVTEIAKGSEVFSANNVC